MEVWKEVPGVTAYEVSTQGRVKSKTRIVENNGKARKFEGRILRDVDNGKGYRYVYLYADGSKKKCYVHRLVALCFIPNPYGKPCVNHIDNNPSNNRVENLEWCTKKENTEWMIKQGRAKRTEQWLNNLRMAQKSSYKAVIGTNIKTGETVYFERLNDVKRIGFSAGDVCVCCKKKTGTYKGYRWKYA